MYISIIIVKRSVCPISIQTHTHIYVLTWPDMCACAYIYVQIVFSVSGRELTFVPGQAAAFWPTYGFN